MVWLNIEDATIVVAIALNATARAVRHAQIAHESIIFFGIAHVLGSTLKGMPELIKICLDELICQCRGMYMKCTYKILNFEMIGYEVSTKLKRIVM